MSYHKQKGTRRNDRKMDDRKIERRTSLIEAEKRNEIHFLSSIFLSSNPAEGPEGDEFSSDVHPLDVPQRCVLKKASQVCFKLVKVAAEGGNPQGGVRKNQEQPLRPH